MAVIHEKRDRILIITLDRADSLNSMDPEMLIKLSEVMTMLRDDPDVWVCVITGAGDKAFSAGADLKKLVPVMRDGTFQMPPTIMRGLHIWKPIIAAVNGMALGAGLELMLSCDIRIVAENVVLGLPEVKWGVMPGLGGTQRLPRMVPWAIATKMILFGETITAHEAYELGLVNKVVPAKEVLPVAMEWAKKICDNAPLAVRAAKEAMYQGVDMRLDDGLEFERDIMGRLIACEDASEGLRAFAEKRKPVYQCK